jgi:hypothetical protein
MTRKNMKIVRAAVLALAIAVLPTLGATQASAAQITDRTVTIGSSAASTVTTYTFDFTVPSATVLQSASFVPCTTASGACTTPSGFTGASSTVAQPTNLGDASGWATTDSTATELRLSKSGNSAAPTGAQTVVFSTVTNPSTTNSTFFVRMTTFSNANWTGAVDAGTVAASTSTQVVVSLAVDETLTFCTGTSITGTNCGTVAGSTVNLGLGSTTATSTGTSVMAASTNGSSGYTVTVSGDTLRSGATNTITALAAGTASSTGASQFGINLVANTAPSVGSAVTGSGTAAASPNYGGTNTFRYGTGEPIATVAGATNANAFTVSYIANISGLTPAGNYQTTLTYVATANF